MIVRSDIVQCDKKTALILVKKLSDKFGYNIPFIAAHLVSGDDLNNPNWTVQIAGKDWTVPELLVVIRVWAEGFVEGRAS